LEQREKLSMIIAKDLKKEQKEKLVQMLKRHKRVISWKITNIKRDQPSFCTHKILLEDDAKPAVQLQRRLNPNMKDIVKRDVIKLLDKGIIYHISYSIWVSPMIVAPNDKNELIPMTLITSCRICIDYRKLNEATRKDYFHSLSLTRCWKD
jgi:hypothetical protein